MTKTIKNKSEQLPHSHSKELEMIVLGGMINSKEDLLIAIKEIQDDDFADPKHQKIFNAIKEAAKAKGVVDTFIIGEVLLKLKKFGGRIFLIEKILQVKRNTNRSKIQT